MQMHEMKPYRRYVVTKGSDDGTFLVGDPVNLAFNGDILHVRAGGWIMSENTPGLCKGAEVKLDLEWLKGEQERLQALRGAEVC